MSTSAPTGAESAKTVSEGWNTHDGGPMPVTGDMLVDVVFRDGTKPDTEQAAEWEWGEQGDGTIVAYRLSTPSLPQPSEEEGEKLKPCGHCGGWPELLHGAPGCWWVRCNICKVQTEDGQPERVTAVWNKRTPQLPTVSEAPLSLRDRVKEKIGADPDLETEARPAVCQPIGVDEAVEMIAAGLWFARQGESWAAWLAYAKSHPLPSVVQAIEETRRDARHALNAVQSSAWNRRPASEPVVKGLVWERSTQFGGTEHCQYAKSILGTWSVWDFEGEDSHMREPEGYAGKRIGGDIEQAKAAAEADYRSRILSTLEPPPSGGSATEAFDFLAYLARERAWSEETFGPHFTVKRNTDHIRKELAEIEADPHDLEEWIDVVILALDGAWRAGHSPEAVIAMIEAKQSKNEGRSWPDWRTADPHAPAEHIREDRAFLQARSGQQ